MKRAILMDGPFQFDKEPQNGTASGIMIKWGSHSMEQWKKDRRREIVMIDLAALVPEDGLLYEIPHFAMPTQKPGREFLLVKRPCSCLCFTAETAAGLVHLHQFDRVLIRILHPRAQRPARRHAWLQHRMCFTPKIPRASVAQNLSAMQLLHERL